MNLLDFFDAGVASHPDAPCFEDCGRDAPAITYAQAGALTCQIARGLRALGLAPGFHGAVLSGNAGAAFTALLGVLRAGGVWLPVNARNGVEANIEFLQDMDCDVLFYQARYAGQVAEIRGKLPRIRHCIALDDAQGPDLSVARLVQGHSPEMFAASLQPQGLAMIMGTGGTTGRSKGVMLSHRNLTATMANHLSAMAVTDRMTVLAAAPITHTAGLVSMPFMARGGRVVLMDGIDPQNLLQVIAQERVNMLFLPPTVIYTLLAQPNVRDFDFSTLRYLMYGAAPMSPDKLAEAIDVFGPVMLQIYGQAEVPGAISVLRVEDHFVDGRVAPRQRLLSAGRRFPFTRVAIMDDDGNLLTQPGAVGEIVAQGDIVTAGYYKNPEATAAAFTPDGWLRTGDLGHRDADGFFFVTGRIKELIIKGGENIAPREIDEALLKHPAVLDAAAVGIPDPHYGQEIMACIVLREGHAADAETLRAFCEQALGRYKTPKRFLFVADLPRGPSGKVQRLKLAELA